ncbi:hypothetical protein Ahy_B08g089656 isoform F [Arachis hypogaea]|uniref:Argonaute linker 2 domain-containing protein n=1 Tax=Arachis hypogaea TaxID=3818 RepID=A0A444XYH2_ARAHY|nr:hypothetical protein Ahy_B08g089656 isoform F [Arachis hypogaea]
MDGLWMILAMVEGRYCEKHKRNILRIDMHLTIRHNAYDQDPYAKEFGIKSEKLASVEARILPAPWVEKALEHVYHVSTTKMKGKGLELLLAILPDNNASLYGDLENL